MKDASETVVTNVAIETATKHDRMEWCDTVNAIPSGSETATSARLATDKFYPPPSVKSARNHTRHSTNGSFKVRKKMMALVMIIPSSTVLIVALCV